MKTQSKLISGLLLGGLMAILPVAQAQVYLPGLPSGQNPASDVDPALYRTFTGAGGRTTDNCRGAGGDCLGVLLHRLSAPRVEGGQLIFDWEIKAGQSPSTENVLAIDADMPGNLIESLRINLHFNVDAFSELNPAADSAANWGPQCTVTEDLLADSNLRAGKTYATQAVGDVRGMQLVASNGLKTNLGFFDDDEEREALALVIPHQTYVRMGTVSCPIRDDTLPANIAFQSNMVPENSQMISDAGSEFRPYASVASNNLWYYPLDNAPAIIGAELGNAAGDHAYLDLIFSEEVVTTAGTASTARAEIFNAGSSIHISSISDFTTGAPADVSSATVTVSRVSTPSATVWRLHFTDDPKELALGVMSDHPHPAIVITPPLSTNASGIQDLDGNPLHTGPAWQLVVPFDSQAPYIETAEVMEQSKSIKLTFNEPVQFGVAFDDMTPPQATTTAILPSPSTAAFVIVHYTDDGGVEEFHPEGIEVAAGSAGTLTELSLVMPTDREYSPSETIDVRIAERLQDESHPSLASVFDVVDADTKFKNGKFATQAAPRISNFPRTAAPAQVGSLQLRGREYQLVRLNEDQLTVATGDSIELRFRLDGPVPLKAGESVTIAFTDGNADGLFGLPDQITFTAASTETSITWTPDKNALDDASTSRAFSGSSSLVPQLEEVNGPITVAVDPDSVVTGVQVDRTFRVAVFPEQPAHYDVRGMSVQTIELGVTEGGAALQEDEFQLTFEVALHVAGESMAIDSSTTGILVTSDDADTASRVDSASLVAQFSVTLTPTTQTVTFTVSITDNTLPETDLQVVTTADTSTTPVKVVYAGTNPACEANDGCIATVRAAGGRSFSLAFQSESGEALDKLALEAGENADAFLAFSMPAGDVLNDDESVTVNFGTNPADVSGIEITPTQFTFSPATTIATVTLMVSEDAYAGTFMLWVESTTLTEGAVDERLLINLPASERPAIDVDISPVVAFIPPLEVVGVAPGGVITTVVTASTTVYALVPGIGARTPIDATAFLEAGFSPSLGVCVMYLAPDSMADEQVPSRCNILSGSPAAMSAIELPPFRSALYWVGLNADGDVATDSAGNRIQLGTPQVVYVAPPIGFTSSFWAYDRTQPVGDLLLEIGGFTTGGRIPSNEPLDIEAMAAVPVSAMLSFQDGKAVYSTTDLFSPDGLSSVSTEVRIITVDGFGFRGGEKDQKYLQLDTAQQAKLEDHTFYSLGNDRITLLPQDGPLPDSSMAGQYDGPFLSSAAKEIDLLGDLGGFYSVTVFRFSTESSSFVEMSEEISQVAAMVIDANVGTVTINPDATTPMPIVLSYSPSTDTSIFEIVISTSSVVMTEGETTTETTITKIRTFAVDAIPLSGGMDAFAGDGVTLVHGDMIQPGPYAVTQSGQDTVLADIGALLPELPDSAASTAFDFAVNGAPSLQGGLAVVIIELPDGAEAEGSAYYVYQQQAGGEWDWALFVTYDGNRVFSAPKPCPAVSASREPLMGGEGYAWQLADEKGLGQNHECLLVEFDDGGMNDADQTPNTFAYSTGGLAFLPGGSSRGGGGAMDFAWLLILALIVMLRNRINGVRLH